MKQRQVMTYMLANSPMFGMGNLFRKGRPWCSLITSGSKYYTIRISKAYIWKNKLHIWNTQTKRILRRTSTSSFGGLTADDILQTRQQFGSRKEKRRFILSKESYNYLKISRGLLFWQQSLFHFTCHYNALCSSLSFPSM
jgi:hypothetical protein